MAEGMYPYIGMYNRDDSNISIEHWRDSQSVGMHQHVYYELLIIDHGSCRHIYNNTETLLIPGDAVIVAANHAHGLSLYGEASVYNCQFLLGDLDEEITTTLCREQLLVLGDSVVTEGTRFWQELLTNRDNEKAALRSGYEINSNKQGVVHLSPNEHSFVNMLLDRSLQEQDWSDACSRLIKLRYLEVVLLELRKAFKRQNEKYLVCSKANQKAIAEVLLYMEDHLTEPFDLTQTAKRYAFSPNYFRKIFKDVTGLAPVQYMNRLKMIRAFSYIQQEKMSIKEAAEAVGIYDLNYFSRLFKKIMGYPPRTLVRS